MPSLWACLSHETRSHVESLTDDAHAPADDSQDFDKDEDERGRERTVKSTTASCSKATATRAQPLSPLETLPPMTMASEMAVRRDS